MAPDPGPGALPAGGQVLAMAILVAAAAIRFFRLGAPGLWVDEAWTGLLIRVSPRDLLSVLRNDDAPPLFYLLQTLVTAIAGSGEWGLRLLPALAGTAAVAATWNLVRRRVAPAALPAAAALGFSSVAVHYAQQARSYALLHLLTVLALVATLALRERPARRTGVWFLLACLGLAYCHNLGVLVVAAAIAVGPVSLIATRPHRRMAMVVLALLALGMIPWAVALLPQLGAHETGNTWMAAWWTGRGGLLLGPFYTLAALANGAGSDLHLQVPLPTFPSSLAGLRWVAWALGALGLIGAAASALVLRRARGDKERDLLVAAAIFSAVPLLGLVLVSILAGPAYVVGRTDTLALPGLAILLGIGWTNGLRRIRRELSPRWGRLPGPIATITWIVLGIAALAPAWRDEGRTSKGSDRALAAQLEGDLKSNDAVVFAALTRPSLEYYGRRLGWWDRLGWKGSFPSSFDRNAAGSWAAPLDSAAAWQREAIGLRERWERDNTGAVWLLAVRDPDGSDAPAGAGGRAEAVGAEAAGTSAAGAAAAWPTRPEPPPPSRSRRTAASVAYPGNVLMSALVGLKPAEVVWEYRQDWVSGDRIVLRLPRPSWVSLDSIPKLETRP